MSVREFLLSYAKFVVSTYDCLAYKAGFFSFGKNPAKIRENLINYISRQRITVDQPPEFYNNLIERINQTSLALKSYLEKHVGEIRKKAEGVVEHFRGKQFVESKQYNTESQEEDAKYFITSDRGYDSACKDFFETSKQLLKHVDLAITFITKDESRSEDVLTQEIVMRMMDQIKDFDRGIKKFVSRLREISKYLKFCNKASTTEQTFIRPIEPSRGLDPLIAQQFAKSYIKFVGASVDYLFNQKKDNYWDERLKLNADIHEKKNLLGTASYKEYQLLIDRMNMMADNIKTNSTVIELIKYVLQDLDPSNPARKFPEVPQCKTIFDFCKQLAVNLDKMVDYKNLEVLPNLLEIVKVGDEIEKRVKALGEFKKNYAACPLIKDFKKTWQPDTTTYFSDKLLP